MQHSRLSDLRLSFLLNRTRAALLLFLLAVSTAFATTQQNYTTSTFSWGGGTMIVPVNVVVGGPTTSFTGATNAALKLYTSTGTLVATYTSSSGTASNAAANAVTDSVLDSGPVNFGSISAGSYYLVYTGTKGFKDPDFNQYWYAYWPSTPIAPTPTTFSLDQTSFTYNGSAQGPNVVASPSGATFSTGGTLSATNAGSYTGTATATGDYSGSNSSLTWTINKANQSISFSNPGTQTYGTPLTLGASASSGLGITYTVNSGPASVSGNVLTFTGIGSVTVTASQGGDSNTNAASDVSQTFTVNAVSTTFSLSATSFTYTGSAQGPTVISSPSGATFSTGGTLSATSPGSYNATASATGNYSGSNSSLGWSIGKANQTITFSNPGTKTYGTPLTLGATASSGLTVSYAVTSGPATVSGNVVTFTGTGSVTITASQAGNANFNAASNVSQTFTVNAASVTFTLSATSFNYNGSAQGPTVIANPSGATFTTGGTLSATAIGSYTATATATGNYTGSNSSLGWSIASGTQTITFNNPGAQLMPAPLTLSATTSSGLTISYAVTSGPATVSGNVVTFTGTGSVTITASQAGNSNYGPATPVSQTFTVSKATPTGTFANRTITQLTGTTYSVKATDLNATFAGPSGSGVTAPTGTVTYTVVGPGTTVTTGTALPSDATYSIQASYPGDTNYNSATITSTWIIVGATTDANHNGIPDVIEAQLGTNTSATPQTDSSNQTELKISKPQ